MPAKHFPSLDLRASATLAGKARDVGSRDGSFPGRVRSARPQFREASTHGPERTGARGPFFPEVIK